MKSSGELNKTLMRMMADNGGRRFGVDRRKLEAGPPHNERRSGTERRSGLDRRKKRPQRKGDFGYRNMFEDLS